ncbi:MAG TPA: hypothetical protein VK898_06585 [Chloroflexota bacterium]|nr:hypothetical protein [Chloroflexota bacterium]
MIFDAALGNFGPNADPQARGETARAADELGFRALWTADHLLPPSSQSQFARVFHEPLICAAYAVSIPRRVRPQLPHRAADAESVRGRDAPRG